MGPVQARWLVLLALVSVMGPRPVRADERTLGDGVTIATDDPCLSRDALLEAVRAWLGRDTIDAQIEVLIESSAGTGSVVVLREGAARATRRFDRLPAACADRRAVLGLAVAIAIDAALLESLAPAVPEPEPVTDPAPTPEATLPDAAASGPAVAVELGARGGLAVGLLRDASALVALDVGVLVGGTLRIALGAETSSPVTRALGGGSVQAMLIAGRLRVCAVRPDALIELAGCLGISAGSVLGEGTGYARSFSVAQPWIAGALELEAAWWLDPRVGLHLSGEARVPFTTTGFEVLDGLGNAIASDTLDPVAAVLSMGIRVRIDSP